MNKKTDGIGFKQKMGIALGGFGATPIYALISTYLVYFYTDIMGVNIGTVTAIIMCCKVFDGISDIVLGNMIDKTRTKLGVCRPWVIRSSILALIGTILMFAVPNVSDVGKYIYIFVSYNIAQTIVYTIVWLSILSLPTYMTRDTNDRTKLFIWSGIGQSVITIIVSSFTLSIVNAFGNGQRGWILTGVVYGVVAAAGLLIAGITCEETVNPDEVAGKEAKQPLLVVIKSAFQNKYWLELMAMSLIGMAVSSITFQMHAYYAKYILGDVSISESLNMIYSMPIIFVSFVLLPLCSRISKRNLVLYSSIAQTIGCLLIIFAPKSFGVLMVGTFLKSMGYSFAGLLGSAMLADTIEYGHWKTGVRCQAALMSAGNVGQKVGIGLCSAILGGVLSAASFDGTLAVQTTTAMSAITNLFLYAPLLLTVVEIVVILVYDLDKKYDQIVADLEERKQQGNH